MLWLAALLLLQGSPAEPPARPAAGLEPPMTFRHLSFGNNADSQVLRASGRITSETPARFKAFLAADQYSVYLKWIAFDSGGGDLVPALELGRLIREEGFRSAVERIICPQGDTRSDDCSPEVGRCESACAYSFLGGMERRLDLSFGDEASGRLGIHQFYSDTPLLGAGDRAAAEAAGIFSNSEAQYTSSLLAKYLSDMGVDVGFLRLASNAGPDSMYYPTAPELRELKVLWEEQYLPFRLLPDGEGVSAVSGFSSGASHAQQVGFYCGKDRLQSSPRLVYSRAKVIEGRKWFQKGSPTFPGGLAAVTGLQRRLGSDEPAEMGLHDGRSTREQQWSSSPDEAIDGINLEADDVREAIRPDQVWLFADANLTHVMVWPSPAFLEKLMSASKLSISIDAANVFAFGSAVAEIKLGEADRQAIRAATRACSTGAAAAADRRGPRGRQGRRPARG